MDPKTEGLVEALTHGEAELPPVTLDIVPGLSLLVLGELAQVRSAGLIDELEPRFLGDEQAEHRPISPLPASAPTWSGLSPECRSRRHRRR